MNIFHKYTKVLMLGMTVVASAMFTSCADEPDKYEATDGLPTVKYIRCLSTEIQKWDDPVGTHYTTGELVTSAAPGSTICLIGDNLRSVHDVIFNDIATNPNPSYITDNTLIITVPASVPTEVSDKIYLVTAAKDTVSVDFKVAISAPIINSMQCEYAQAGDLQQITGNYFIDDPNVHLEILFTGANGTQIPAKIEKIDEDYRFVNIIVPEGAVPGPIYAKSVYGTSKSAFEYMDRRGMLFDFDTPSVEGGSVLGNHGWHNMTILSDESSLLGNFLQLGDGEAEMDDEAWNDGHFSFEYWCGSWDTPQNITSGDGIALFNVVDFSDWENMSVKFEMNIPHGQNGENAWQAGAMQIAFQPIDQVTLSGNPITGFANVGGANQHMFNNDTPAHGAYGRAMYRPWVEEGTYDTAGQWVTVTIPLKNFIYDYEGKLLEAPSFTKASDFASFDMFVLRGGISGKACKPIIKIDNIRVVPNK